MVIGVTLLQVMTGRMTVAVSDWRRPVRRAKTSEIRRVRCLPHHTRDSHIRQITLKITLILYWSLRFSTLCEICLEHIRPWNHARHAAHAPLTREHDTNNWNQVWTRDLSALQYRYHEVGIDSVRYGHERIPHSTILPRWLGEQMFNTL